ncbi:MAG: tRNA pseudouridine(55) synthase TruB [Steroidobacteraceae bacterium]
MPSGILLLDKPLGLSSNAVLQRVKHLLGARKAGHVGSLDPLASGMLPIVLDEATKIAGEILSRRKCYRFTLALGARTRTGDTEGAIVETLPVPPLARADVDRVFAGFRGVSLQLPPMFSALKQGGQPLYALARAGIEVDRKPREIEILCLEPVAIGPSSLEAEVVCSKGTYVRTLGEDIAVKLGTCGHLAGLRRLYVEPFAGEPMTTLDALEAALAGDRAPALLAPDAALGHLPAVEVAPDAVARLRHGQAVGVAGAELAPVLRLYGPDQRFIGLGSCEERGIVQPRRLLADS